MKKIAFILLMLIGVQNVNSQRMLSTSEDRKYFVINVLSSSTICGIQSCIFNRPKKSIFKTFGQAFIKGTLGGSLQFISKEMLKQSSYNDNYNLVWPARIINSVGTSICISASQNQNIFSNYYMQVYMTYVHYNFKQRKIGVQIDPITCVGIGYNLIKGNQIDVKTSLQTGSVFFIKNPDKKVYSFENFVSSEFGISIGNTIATKTFKINIFSGPPKYEYNQKTINKPVIFHELTHVFDYISYNYILSSKVFGNKLNKIFNINLNFAILYTLNNINGYNNNIYEKSADFYGNCFKVNPFWKY
jgi:hypothetical protein